MLNWQQDWSPNGRWIAYQREGGPRLGDDIFKIRADGTHKTYLSASCVEPCKADYAPFWSPDGTLISFTRFSSTCHRRGFTPPVFVMRSDGTDLRQVTQIGTTPDQLGFEDYSPIWSPGGKRFAFERYDPTRTSAQFFIVRIDGTGLRRITPWNSYAADPDCSPDGRWIAFRTHEDSDEIGDIGLVHPNDKDLHLITSDRGKWVSCSFSPNGKRIVGAWPAGGLPSNPDLYVMNLDGSHFRNVTRSKPWESAPDWGPLPK